MNLPQAFIERTRQLLGEAYPRFEEALQKATIKICGLGFYHLYIDGVKVGNYSLSPLETAYRKLALYDEFDICFRCFRCTG